MNSSEFAENSDGETSEKERLRLCRVKTESEDPVSYGPEAELDRVAATKRMKVCAEGLRTREHTAERVGRHTARPRPSGLMSPAEGKDPPPERTIASYRKPLYSISHRITEKKAASGLEQHILQEPGGRLSCSGLLLPSWAGEAGRRQPSPAAGTAGTAAGAEADLTLYPLIEKMFFILNTLNSSMTQLHSKVDLLSLEVARIKRRIDPRRAGGRVPAAARAPADGRGAAAAGGADLVGRRAGLPAAAAALPELFAPSTAAAERRRRRRRGACSACGGARQAAPDSLHLQLVRNYVEACFPLARERRGLAGPVPAADQRLLQPLLGAEGHGGRRPPRLAFEPEPGQAPACHYIDEDGRDEESLSPEPRGDNLNNGGGGSNETWRKVPEGYGCYGGSGGSVGKLVLDSDRLEVIRKYMEANFPDVPEDSWLQLCVQRMEEVLECAQGNGDGSEPEIARGDESYDSASLPDDVSIVKIGGDFRDYERPGQACKQAKKSSLVPVDFDKVEIPPPDFDVPPEHLLSREQLKANYECSLSIGNFASRLLVLMFPELFTYENARKNYNCSGSLGKKQLDPVRVNLIRHYVQLLYPRAKNDRVWTLEFVGKLDERCRRRDTEQRRSYQQQRKRFREDFEIPPLPPEKSNKDFCKIPLEELTVGCPDFPVPSAYLLSDAEVREIVQQSLSVGNFAARLLVRLFPELFTQENLRLQYNHSGACNKKQLDPLRLRLIRHYVEAVYPVDKMEEVWHYECVPSIDERCRRPNRKKCDILKKAKRSSAVSYL
ncbi:hypothetical protein ANANG_G00004840 [Anguilla anguilla]|uniref:BEN domain-containing protein n=1 Tax=Anguilla anguilla TaxID=7936 RepID=A0A9D3S623_ANGAN|nr:hypothetical protein ANANG_G00004840 [Anguilla anguilla]